jgi:hypothetical protein
MVYDRTHEDVTHDVHYIQVEGYTVIPLDIQCGHKRVCMHVRHDEGACEPMQATVLGLHLGGHVPVRSPMQYNEGVGVCV